MNPDTWRRVEDLFHQAVEKSGDERAAFLLEAIPAQDDEIRVEVLRLLAEHDAEPEFMAKPIFETGIASDALNQVESEAGDELDARAIAALTAGLHIDGYRLIELIGEGGGGLVYLAEQESPRRMVALKIIRPGFVTKDTLRRFEHEAEILGRLRHPGIAQVFEAGTADAGGSPLPYFAMERIDGVPLTRFARDHELSLEERLILFGHICDAVQYAHQQGVIHRDLKPGNILVEDRGPKHRDPLPKILDFGVARVMDPTAHSIQTGHTHLIGTLPYMSPEQIAADPAGVDTRSDVYALGVILYELLADERPHRIENTTLTEAIRIIAEDTPKSLSSVNHRFKGDLETIVGKAMEKDRDLRYQTAFDLAADVRRFLQHEAIMARPPSTMYQMRKFARRNRTLVGGMAGVFLALVAGLATTLWQERQARENAKDALANANRAESSALRANLKAEQVTAINDFLQEILTLVNNPSATQNIKVADLLDRAATDVSTAFADRPLAEASVRETLGDSYYRLGRVNDAEAQYQRSYVIRERELGLDDAATLGSMTGVASCWMGTGRFDEAEAMFEDVLNGRRRVIGPFHHKTLGILINLAAIENMRGRTDEAESLFRDALVQMEKHLGPDDRNSLVCKQNLASLLREQERYDEAEPLYRETLESFERQFGENNQDTLKAIDNLAIFLKHAGRLDEAEPYYERSVEGFKRVLGEQHPGTITSMHNYATFLYSRREYDRAMAVFDEAVELASDALGDRDWLTQAVRRRYASILKRRDRYEKSESQYLNLYNACRDEYGDDHDRTYRIIREMVDLYERWERPEKATEYSLLLPKEQDDRF